MEQASTQVSSSEVPSVLSSLTEQQLQLVKEVYVDGFNEGLTFAASLLESGINDHYGSVVIEHFLPEYLKVVTKNDKQYV